MTARFRPPFEYWSFLLEVTRGCSHNSCAFCSMYRDEEFGVVPEEEVRAQIERYARLRPRVRRAFLENGDAFVLSADRLLRVCDLLHGSFEALGTISMYASVPNIASKTDAELAALARAGVDDLNVGLESGLDAALSHMNKGYTAAEATEQLLRLGEAGMSFSANLILGIAGAGRGLENARATAEVVNRTRPRLVFTNTIHAEPGTPLREEMDAGAFAEPTVGEYLDEEEALLEALDVPGCRFYGLHPSNVVLMEGDLDADKDELLRKLRAARADLAAELGEVPARGAEGMVGL